MAQLQPGAVVSKEDLAEFYAEQDPSKVASVDAILAGYSTQHLVANLVKKYGHAPAAAVAKRGSVAGQIGGMIMGWGAT